MALNYMFVIDLLFDHEMFIIESCSNLPWLVEDSIEREAFSLVAVYRIVSVLSVT